ncbi:hypothetical protein [Piscinibacter sp.]|uniref:hypothetical protein n=1 Tax=Piscinibacter sp. TaxID=1903157 RepID=UPI002D06DA8E|nr:hypothetical protein [Albitalea sp.]HUG25279.1 hypothetical protein [Albitalea sp.]
MTTIRVPRRATQLNAQTGSKETQPLLEWRALDAYVLLGDPGAGKSWAFEDECNAVAGSLVSARDVVAGIAPTDVTGRTVFIDGLDEVRAGATDGRVPFDAIRKWLYERGRPRFRLSCREADWLGSSDTDRLKQIAPGERVAELHLEPLLDADIEAILAGRADEVPDPQAFLLVAERAGLTELLRNPLLLDLTIKAMADGSSPRTRKDIYEAACKQLAREHNAEHLAATQPRAGHVDRVLDDAGVLCALILLSGKRGIARRGTATPDAVDLCALPMALACHDAPAAMGSKVFTFEDDVAVPRHRSIGEFLAGRALAQRVEGGLPIGRVMALMQGIDGFPVEPLRGLWAWLAAHHSPSRKGLIAIDPLGFVLNGDAASLLAGERVDVLHALRDAAEKDPWFRNAAWVSHPFGPLATADMASTYQVLLRDPRHDRGHESFIDCVFDALQHGEPMPSLASALEAWIEDGSATRHLRVAAYEAWKRSAGFSVGKALTWLQAIRAGSLPDHDDELCGALLHDLYPAHLPPARVFDHWHVPKRRNLTGNYGMFWGHALWAQTPHGGFAELAESWLRRQPALKSADLRDYDAREIPNKLLAGVLEHAGDHASNETLYEWLGLCLDEYGFSRLEDQQHVVRTWLAERPDRMKAVMAIGLSNTRPDEEGHWPFWKAESRLHGASRPRDWLFWLLDHASTALTPEVAAFCFFPAAHAAIEPMAGLDSPSMEQVEAWVAAHKARWPNAEQWLEDAWSMRLDHWKGDEGRRRRRALAQQIEEEEKRKRELGSHLPSLLDGTAPPGLLYHVAVAHEHGFSDLRGETPLERVRNYLVSDEATAEAVIAALPRVLERTDLPRVEEAIALEAKGKQHYIRPAALLAARLVDERDANSPLSWRQALVERLVAYYLTDGTGEMPGWYRTLAHHRPEWVAPVLVQYARPKFKRKGNQFFAGLWALSSEADHAQLARLALPRLLDAFPLRASEAARNTLNRTLLPALSSLDHAQAAALVRMKLRQEGMDPAQRICWLIADLAYRAEAAQDLAALVGRNERRAVILGAALNQQDTLTRVVQRLQPRAIRHLIEVLAPITGQDSWRSEGVVTDTHHRHDTVRSLFSALSSDPSAEAREALLELANIQGLRAWSDTVQYSLRTQAAAAREASFHAPDPTEVALALANLAPANPSDLRALVMQHLADLQAQWRGVDTFALKLFWRDAGHAPQLENDCRDLLLDQLRRRLKPLNILVGREHSAAQDKRVDQCAEFMRDGQRIALPIEIKKNDDRRLWTAWHDQLQRLYTIDPDAQGHGLYLVLWFGEKTAPHPEGLKPRDAGQLRVALEERIPSADRHRLAVQVLDLSWPTA